MLEPSRAPVHAGAFLSGRSTRACQAAPRWHGLALGAMVEVWAPAGGGFHGWDAIPPAALRWAPGQACRGGLSASQPDPADPAPSLRAARDRRSPRWSAAQPGQRPEQPRRNSWSALL